jgi:hypothetical protein
MNHAIHSTQYCHSWGDLLKSSALMSALPKKFILKSSASRSLPINPAITPLELIPLVKGWKPIMATESTVTYMSKGAVLTASFLTGRVDLHVYSSDPRAEEIVEKAMAPFEKFKFENKEENGVWVNFCYSGVGGVSRNTQFLRCPKWSEIQGNYPSVGQDELGRLMKMKRPWNDGRLMIWHGDPGTGKTFAIRSLLMAWRERFNFVIVTDPEKLMANPAYYYEISSAPNMNSIPGAQSQDDDDGDSSESKKKRLLFIIEDSADLISVESRQRHWDKFGKLLNITDGLIGQGREDIFLLTFNEELEEIDPAIVRPGRCISRVEFGKFTPEDSEKWLEKNCQGGLRAAEADVPGVEASLAELYQIKANIKKQVTVTV